MCIAYFVSNYAKEVSTISSPSNDIKMNSAISRRSLLKKTLFATGGAALGSALPWGAMAGTRDLKPFWTNKPRLVAPPNNYWDYPLKAKLNANENKFGPSKLAQKAIVDAVSGGNLYAHKEVQELSKILAEKEGVKPEQIMLGPGSTDLLEKIAVMSFMDGKGNIISADPAYMSVVKSAQKVGAEWKNIPALPDWSHDLDKMMAAIDGETRLIYVCNPNNPTGAITPADKLKTFCSAASEKVPVFVDEAYLEFMDNKAEQKTMVGLISEGKDLIVARTFSKLHGMAGLRVGYIVAKEERIEAINNVLRSSYNLCLSSLYGAMESIKDEDYQKMAYEKNLESKTYTASEFDKMGLNYIPSQTSFMFFELNIDGETYMKNMYEKGVGVRLFHVDEKPWGRVSMGTMEEMKLFVKTLKQVVA